MKVVQQVAIDTVGIEKTMVVLEDEEEVDHVVLGAEEEDHTAVVVEVLTEEVTAHLVKTIDMVDMEVCLLF